MKIKIFCLFILSISMGSFAQKPMQENKNNLTNSGSKFLFPELAYAYDALEPYIDKLTMEIHYSKHFKTYYDNFLKSVKGTELEKSDIKSIFSNISKSPVAVRNNSGGFYNHLLFFENMTPNFKGASGAILEAIVKDFGSYENFVNQFEEAAKTRFGSGWVWLSIDAAHKLFISSTPNQDNPLMDIVDKKGTPLLALDVWEHAYYLKYQNRRPEYISNFWHVVNWEMVNKRLLEALK
ncbi:MAG: superoxide dismutase [Bacteroidota bacterium]